MEIPIQVLHMLEVMHRDFNEHKIIQVPITENQLGETQLMKEVAEHVGMNCPETPDLDMWLNQSTNSLSLSGSRINQKHITIDEDEGFSETMTSPIPEQPLKPRPALLFQKVSATRQLFD